MGSILLRKFSQEKGIYGFTGILTGSLVKLIDRKINQHSIVHDCVERFIRTVSMRVF